MRGNGGSRVMGPLAVGYSGAWSFPIAPFFIMTSDGQSLIFTSTLSIPKSTQPEYYCQCPVGKYKCHRFVCVCGGGGGGGREIKGKINHLFQNVIILFCHI